ncbi:MAG: 3-methyl-2-oxobutanoate hydroxymethyltransferase [Phycisphaerae bacterium]
MPDRKKITIRTLQARKQEQQRFAMLTCYDYTTACLMEEAGIETLLVGDTYAEVVLGHSTTLPVTVDHLVTIAGAVRRGAPTRYLVGDMPYLSYQVSPEEAIRHAGRFMAEAGCDCVKVEVDRRLLTTVERMASATIPVMAHLGLRPQSIQSHGGYSIQGRKADQARQIIEDARLMEEAGAVALLLEAVPLQVAEVITSSASIPVIGICSGRACDGQVLVVHDMLGLIAGHPPPSAKRYASLHESMVTAFRAYHDEVSSGAFPSSSHGVSMDDSEWQILRDMLTRDDDD